MQLPQELVDAIVDEIHPFTDSAPSLKSCALVARSFRGQSQKNLFSVVKLKENSPASAIRFNNLLSRSMHLAVYVSDLSLECHSKNWESVAHILSAVSNLTRLRLTPGEMDWFQTGVRRAAPFPADFSLPPLRIIELCCYEFLDAFQLQSLLSSSTKLEALTLDNIGFSVPRIFNAVGDRVPKLTVRNLTGSPIDSVTTAALVPRDTAVVLSNLTFRNVTGSTIDSILHCFTVVDLKHLHSLSVFDSPVDHVLRLNGRSVHMLNISFYFEDLTSVFRPLEPEILAELGLRLQTLCLDVCFPDFLPGVLRLFGDLRDLTKLEKVSVVFNFWSEHNVDHENAWGIFDGMLRVLLEEGHTLKEVFLHLGHCDASVPARLRSWMPYLNAGGVLRIQVPN
ncbi:hypothetical protein MVEN_00740300 [Mycena venus]|uniref:Uncharacterized protein n=1 Tax=Mycena venus TaxID=2733690 RepID=A0A8H6YJF9_9AGAR|nr:hypothetical protein MVEN_00740300 [Mycena venus]